MLLLESNIGIVHKVIRIYAEDPEDLKDLLQEVVCQAWGSWGRFQGNSKFSTWLYRVALNTALTFRRKHVPIHHHAQLDMAPPASASFEAKELLVWAISKLQPVDRMVILLHLEGHENAEIAEITGIETNNTAVKIHRIRKRLMEILTPFRDGF